MKRHFLALLVATVAAPAHGGCDFRQLMGLLQDAEHPAEQTATQRAMVRAMWQDCVLIDEADSLKIEVSARCGLSAEDAPPVPDTPTEAASSGVLGWLRGWALPPPPPPPAPSAARSSLAPPRDDEASDAAPVCDFTSLLTCSEAELTNDSFCLAHLERCYQVARSYVDGD